MKIDSHQHFWAINDTDYVWMGDEHATIRRDFLPSDLQPLIAECGIDGSVAVQARQMVEETEWLLGLADDHELIRAVVGWVPLCENAGESELERFAGHRKLVGVRHVIHDEPNDDFILREDFNEGIRRLSRYDLIYDILIFWKHLPQTIEFVDRHPGQPFVLDHIAKPEIKTATPDPAWIKNMQKLAKREQVYCKISGMATEVPESTQWTTDLLRPYFDVALEAFGPDRHRRSLPH